MDSDDSGDGTYGFDMPTDDFDNDDKGHRAAGFQINQSSHPSSSSRRNRRRMKNYDDSTSNDDDDSDEDENGNDDNDFAYGAYAKRKRRRNDDDKERNLYGVFYDNDSSNDDDDSAAGYGGGRRSRGSNTKKTKSRHYDKTQNRLAAMTFVKSTTASVDVGQDDDGDKFGTKSEIPCSADVEDDNMDISDKSDGEEDKEDRVGNEDNDDGPEDIQLFQEREKRFHELLEIAKRSKHPLLSSSTSLSVKPVLRQMETEDQNDGSRQTAAADNDKQGDDEYESEPAAFSGLGSSGRGGSNSCLGGIGMEDAHHGMPPPPIMPQQGLGGLGLSGASSFPSFGMGGLGSSQGDDNNNNMMMMGGQPVMKSTTTSTKPKDFNLGKWEKHTKGIGMKLLQKMGYEGSGGLGAKRRRPVVTGDASTPTTSTASADADAKLGTDQTPASAANGEGIIKKGISRPVEVVVRPTGLGLGFGNFKEQSQLKVNRQIEAEVRGIPLTTDNEQSSSQGKKDKKGIYDGIDKSLLPSTESVLSGGAGSWRKGGGGVGGSKKRQKRKIINYQDILKKSADIVNGDGGDKMKIIDMRGVPPSNGSAAVEPSKPTVDVPIGEELLHNVTLLLNMHEGQLRTSSYMVTSTERKIASLEAELKEMSERKVMIENRSNKMKLTLQVIGEAEGLINDLNSSNDCEKMSDNDRLEFAMGSLHSVFVQLYGNFTVEERRSLKFESTLIPSIVNPLFDTLLSRLNPLAMDLSWLGRLASCMQKLCDTLGSNDEACALREMVFLQSIVPWMNSSLSSSKWDPVHDVEAGLRIYEALIDSMCKSLRVPDKEEDALLKECINAEVVHNAVLPKLVRAVSRWKPKLDDDQKVDNPLNLWILPWLPYINDDSMLGSLLDDVRRHLKKTLSFLSKTVSDDVGFVRSCLSALFPWKRLFDEAIMFEMTSNTISPRFARSLAQMTICIDPAAQNWEHLHILFECYERGVMSTDDFVALIDGEVLPAWARTLHVALQQGEHGMKDVKKFYLAWRDQMFDPSRISESGRSAQLTLRLDALVCRYFYGGLIMIQAAVETKKTLLESLTPPHPTECNYRISLMLRSKERTSQNNHERQRDVTVRAQPKASHHGGRIAASFQDVVEEFANQHDISFYPKNSMKDGKPIYMFGDHPVYIDKNVLFSLRGSHWQPISLEHLAQSC